MVLEQIFSPRRHTNGQQVYEKVFNITNYQGNENHNVSMVTTKMTRNYGSESHTCQYGYYKKRQELSIDKDMEKRESLSNLRGNRKWCSHYEKHGRGSSKN